jgi:hypothetical protein
MMRRNLRWGMGISVIFVLGVAMAFAWTGARHRGQLSHCRNNLQWLGELAKQTLTEASLNPDLSDFEELKNARGRAFWQVVWKIKLSKKPRELSPFACPFIHENIPLSGTEELKLDQIDYRGPAFNPFDSTKEFVALGADRIDNHGGKELMVVFIRAEPKKRRGRGDDTEYLEFQHRVELIRETDSRWGEVMNLTKD